MAGTMAPIGDAKGAQLALMVEILSAALSASCFGFESSSYFTAEGPPPRAGQFLLALDPGPFSEGRFGARLEDLLAAIEEQPGTRLPGATPVRVARAGGTRGSLDSTSAARAAGVAARLNSPRWCGDDDAASSPATQARSVAPIRFRHPDIDAKLAPASGSADSRPPATFSASKASQAASPQGPRGETCAGGTSRSRNASRAWRRLSLLCIPRVRIDTANPRGTGR